jgi:hypothetical protein
MVVRKCHDDKRWRKRQETAGCSISLVNRIWGRPCPLELNLVQSGWPKATMFCFAEFDAMTSNGRVGQNLSQHQGLRM